MERLRNPAIGRTSRLSESMGGAEASSSIADTGSGTAATRRSHEVLRSRSPQLGVELERVADKAHAAVRSKDAAALQSLIQAHPEVLGAANRRNETLLSAAIDTGQDVLVACVLAHLAGSPEAMAKVLNRRGFAGDTPLLRAIDKGHERIAVSLLRQESIDVNASNGRHVTPLHVATGRGSIALVSALLAHPDIAPSLPDGEGNTPLHLAARSGNAAIVSKLVEHPSVLASQANKAKLKPWHLAIGSADAGTVKALFPASRLKPEAAVRQVIANLEMIQRRFSSSERAADAVTGMVLAIAGDDRDFDPGRTPWPGGRNLLTHLCSGPPHTVVPPLRLGDPAIYIKRVGPLIAGSLAASGRVNINISDALGNTPFATALAENTELAKTLFNSEHFDRNVLTPVLMNRETEAFATLFAWLRPASRPPSTSDQHTAFLRGALLSFVDQQDPRSTGQRQRHANPELAMRTNLELGRLLASEELAARETGGATGARDADPCPRDAVFRLSLALELCLKFARAENLRDIASQLLTASKDSGTAVFNIGGTPLTRNEIESWAAGRLPPAIEKRSLDRMQQVFDTQHADPHGVELRSRGHRALEFMKRFGNGHAASTSEEALASCERDMEFSGIGPQGPATAGLDWVKSNNALVLEGLDTTPKEALAVTWSYIQAQQGELRESLHAALEQRLTDIARERPCATGIVQRLLDTPNGIDHQWSDAPDEQTMRQEMLSIGAMVNNLFEAEHVTPDEDDETTVALKIDLVRAAAVSDLVGRRGWDPKKVEPILDKVLEEMSGL